MAEIADKNRLWTIGELSREFKATQRALRFYEDKGLLHPQRDGMNRLYSVRDRARLQLILRGKRVGFTLSEIREMIDLYDLGDNQRAQMHRTLEKYVEQVGLLRQQHEDIVGSIKTLESGIEWLRKQLAKDPADIAAANANAYDALARARLDGDEMTTATH